MPKRLEREIGKECVIVMEKERLDGVGGFCTYGLIDNTATVRATAALPIALSEDCVLRRDISKDEMVSFDDVEEPPRDRLVEELWREQNARWPRPTRASRLPSLRPAPAGSIA